MTYTLLVLLAGLLAKGARGAGRAGRFLLAAGIDAGAAARRHLDLLLSPDHTGTAVALLVIWLLIDRARPRLVVPVRSACCSRTMVADSIVLLTGIVPLVLVGGGALWPG